ncbi:MAG: hypothetical protein K2G44_03505 [Clostridia bacterium]|nr:hypothetical protein [Clostridia bacterium]
MKKRRKKDGAKFLDNKVQLALIISLLVLFVVFGSAVAVSIFVDLSDPAAKWLALVTGSVDALSVFLVPVLSIWITGRVMRSKAKLEEDLKIEPDHHKIICQYSKHSRELIDHEKLDDNMCNKDGVMMSLCSVNGKGEYNPVRDVHSDAFFERQRDINTFKNGRLLLPSVSVFTNTQGVTISFDDCLDRYELPMLLQENAAKLMSAHRASNVSNGSTIRLNDFTYENSRLVLSTQRSGYMSMLMTNRCMDFDMDGMTVRALYEHGSAVSPLKKSKLCNQIGINGLVYTNDGYLLVEKRGHKKAVWKNKFAQPISLALKLSDVKTDSEGKIGPSPADAEACFKNVIAKTLRGNFGLALDSDYTFNLSKNFMGIARDLLEGGKPNLYFYVVANMSGAELKNYLEANSQLAVRVSEARGQLGRGVKCRVADGGYKTYLSQIDEKYKTELRNLVSDGFITVSEGDGDCKMELVSVKNAKPAENAEEAFARLDALEQSAVDQFLAGALSKNLPKVNRHKLDSRFYLIKREDFVFDYNYTVKIPVNKTYPVQRKFYPCVGRIEAKCEAVRVRKPLRKYLHYECGEALLASLYYAAVLEWRIMK